MFPLLFEQLFTSQNWNYQICLKFKLKSGIIICIKLLTKMHVTQQFNETIILCLSIATSQDVLVILLDGRYCKTVTLKTVLQA